MKPCQLCGAKSWGEVEGFVDIQVQPASPQYFLIGKDLSQYRRCDNCGSYVSLVQMALEDPPRRDPVEESLGLADKLGASPFTAGLQAVAGMLPKPETRLERLVRAMLQNGAVHRDFIGPRDVVGYARTIESELDSPHADEPVVEGSFVWHAHEWDFRNRNELLRWLATGLDTACERLSRQQTPWSGPATAREFILWMESGGPRE